MRKLLFAMALLFCGWTANAQSEYRQQISLNKDWRFTYGYVVKKNVYERVNIPHTWNQADANSGNLDYYRGLGNYEKDILIKPEWKGKRIFLKFDGVNTVSNTFINGVHVGEHRGGYTSFIYELTNKVKYGEKNNIWVRVTNALHLDVMPLVGDFNFYGGIYRDVHLIVTDKACISPLDYASPGIYLAQSNVSKKSAHVDARVLVSNGYDSKEKFQVELAVKDGDKVVLTKQADVEAAAKQQAETTIAFDMKNPHLWNGRKDPFMYQVVVKLKKDGKVIDQKVQPLGLRFYHVDADKGFFLNGEHLKLQGVCRHQDRSGFGNALQPQHHEEDVAILMEMGANSIRLSHYPHAPYFYDLLDKNGIVTWSEIPLVGPGGYRDKGFVNLPAFKENGRLHLKEMIRQNYNHPSICFWGLFNELKYDGDNPVEYVKELNALAHKEDPTRITTAASFRDGEINDITDLIAWNKYYGWYGGDASYIGTWADEMHKKHPGRKIGVSEYGAGASIFHHQEELKKTNPGAYWHPEAWQAYYHEENWIAFAERPFVWGTYIWNLFDFGAVHRTEGDRAGKNDKGIVSFDRKVKKDAWWFYKANWNKEDAVLYIANRRYIERTEAKTKVRVYSNFDEVELIVNGKVVGKQKSKGYCIFHWDNITLQKGDNRVVVRAGKGKNKKEDTCTWVLQ
ncbi:glycoside hydrolase family 2 protein [Prolixibacteraceae bacterium JC049]|nr:glycoside hydrolase family 2 protein [Prolixibacteraceae bacterium JC049]